MPRQERGAIEGKLTVVGTEMVPLETLSPYPQNPRNGDIELIQESVRAHGQYRAMVANKRTRQVLAGNHLLHALMAEHYREGLVHWVDVDEQEAARIVLVDNRTSDVARYDDGLLAELLQALPDLSATGYSQDYLDDLLKKLAAPDLEQLARDLGEYDESKFWPVLRFQVPPELRDRYLQIVSDIDEKDEVGRFRRLVERAEATK